MRRLFTALLVCSCLPRLAAAADALPGIVFVGAPIFDEKTDGGDGVYQGSYHWRDGYIYPRSATYHRGERTMGPPRPGRNLYSLVPARPDGKMTRLTHLKTGAVYRPEPSYDGKRVLFALRRDGEDWFHLYEINVDGTNLRQLTDGPFNDFAGVYLPDGRIVFCSDRCGYLEEYHEERTETLFTMNSNGTNIRQITFLPGTYFEPSVLRDGRILFSFWDAFHIDVPPFDKHETYLATVNPDGTEERHLFGAGQYRFFNRERHSGVGVGQARELPNRQILCQTEMGPSLIDLRAGLAARDALAPVFPGTTSVQLGGTTHRVHLSPLGTRSTPYPLQDGRFLFSATLPGARDSGIFVCDPNTRDEKLIINIPNYAEFDAVPVLVEREKPARLPTRAKPQAAGLTKFLVVAGRTADNPERAEALERAKYFRVVEAEYTGVTTSSHTNLETRILGTVPIYADGSAYFEAPADTPLFLDPLDADGNRVLMKWSYRNTAVAEGLPYPATQMAYLSGRAGETKACYGCHATQTDAVPNTTLEALKHGPVKITRKSTDLEYRRNEPEAYRTQARLGESAKYRAWLASKDANVRARACEMLALTDDEVGTNLAVLDGLARDPLAAVRQAAATASRHLGSIRQAENRAVSELVPWLRKHEWEYRAAEAAVALGRLGSPQAVAALWDAVRTEVPNKKVHIARYLQHGPRPEEYALLKGLILAGAQPGLKDVHLLIALLPNTFMEKPRFEDRMRPETQRVLMPRLLLEKAGFRQRAVAILWAALRGEQHTDDPLYEQIVKGINLERPFSEHGRPFNVVTKIGSEEALWLLSCLLEPSADLRSAAKRVELENLVVPLLTSPNHRDRIDAAVLLGRTGFGPQTAAVLAREIDKPYPFPEIASMGKGMPDENFRDKAYLALTLARHIDDVTKLKPFADPKTMTRDIRYGLTRGLAFRGNPDGIPLLVEMATRDPITLIRQQARYAVADIQDAMLLAGQSVPRVEWPTEEPLEALYPPRGLTWTDTSFVEFTRDGSNGTLSTYLVPASFRNLNNAQAAGAGQMMIAHVEAARHAVAVLARQPGESSRTALVQLLDTPYPFLHYLAATALAERGEPEAAPALLRKLDGCIKGADTVGFWWCCEALARLKAREVLPTLAKYVVSSNPPNTFGPDGMAVGYVAAKALAQIAADAKHTEVARCLKSENAWVRAGALRGLAEAQAAGSKALVRYAADESNPAIVRQEARVQRHRMRLETISQP